MKIAVTAASGRLGHAILRVLSNEIDPGDVVAIARSPERVAIAGIQKRLGEYRSIEAMASAFSGIETAVMISAPVAGDSDRVALHRNVIEAARRAGVGTLIYTSVIGNGREQGTYFQPAQQVNRQTEADLRSSGLQWIIVRNGLYLELDLAHIIRANPEGAYTNPGADGRAAYITIEELGYATARLAANPHAHLGKTYNLVSECHTQGELVAMANEVFGLKVRYEVITDEACIEKFSKLMPERGEAVARMLTGCFQCIRKGAFDVASDYEAAAGRLPRTVREMMEDCRRKAQSASQPATR